MPGERAASSALAGAALGKGCTTARFAFGFFVKNVVTSFAASCISRSSDRDGTCCWSGASAIYQVAPSRGPFALRRAVRSPDGLLTDAGSLIRPLKREATFGYSLSTDPCHIS